MPLSSSRPKNSNLATGLRFVVVAIVLGFVAYNSWQRQQTQPPVANTTTSETNERNQEATTASESPTARTIIANQTIRDQNGRVVFRGDVDLGPTLDRIRRDERLRFSHDGIVFQNRERRLPRKSADYYHEFVHPTPELSGPGPQRIVVGREGEIFYTPDHYRTFERLNE
jgi:guanyl-specific ribonuclease Sa